DKNKNFNIKQLEDGHQQKKTDFLDINFKNTAGTGLKKNFFLKKPSNQSLDSNINGTKSAIETAIVNAIDKLSRAGEEQEEKDDTLKKKNENNVNQKNFKRGNQYSQTDINFKTPIPPLRSSSFEERKLINLFPPPSKAPPLILKPKLKKRNESDSPTVILSFLYNPNSPVSIES
ncbi:hypothetical protein HK099_003297, partial [Clydaea vesicula]